MKKDASAELIQLPNKFGRKVGNLKEKFWTKKLSEMLNSILSVVGQSEATTICFNIASPLVLSDGNTFYIHAHGSMH